MIAQTADVLVFDRADCTGELPKTVAQAAWDNAVGLFG